MEFKYSDELSITDNSTGGLAGNIPLRRHRLSPMEKIGALRAQRDWQKYVGSVSDFKGGLSSRYGLMQVAVPECRPERLEIIAYASEIGFLYDDCTELYSHDEVSRANEGMQSAFVEGLQRGQIECGAGGLKAVQSVLLKEMVAIDKPRALTAMKVWIEFLEQAAGRQHDVGHLLFDEYLEYRLLDVGEMFWFGLVTFGMALTISESELPLVRRLSRPCWIVLVLQNDVCSYNKEVQAAQHKGSLHMVNALWVLMQEHKIDLREAKEMAVRKIEQHVAEYQNVVAAHRNDAALSEDARIYLESLLYTVSGDAAWSLVTPRYNVNQSHRDIQSDTTTVNVQQLQQREPLVKLEDEDAEDVALRNEKVQAFDVRDTHRVC